MPSQARSKSILDPKNLNGDSLINVMDVAVIGNNFQRTDSFSASNLFVW